MPLGLGCVTVLAAAEFEQMGMKGDEDPKFYFARVLKRAEILKRIGEPRTPEKIADQNKS